MKWAMWWFTMSGLMMGSRFYRASVEEMVGSGRMGPSRGPRGRPAHTHRVPGEEAEEHGDRVEGLLRLVSCFSADE